MLAKLAKEEAARRKAEAEVAKMKKLTKKTILRKIRKPPGSVGKGLKLRPEMRLAASKHKPLYLSILVSSSRMSMSCIMTYPCYE